MSETTDKIMPSMIGLGGITMGAGAIIKLAGFATTGIEKASFAAYLQSLIGNVPADSIFSRVQSFGALGEPTTILYVGGIIIVVGLTYYGAKYYKSWKSTSASDS